MHSKLAQLVAARHRAAQDLNNPLDFRVLATTVYPEIASHAHKGFQYAYVTEQIPESVKAILRTQGYVVKKAPGNMTCIEWCDQVIHDERGFMTKVSPEVYNAYAAAHAHLNDDSS